MMTPYHHSPEVIQTAQLSRFAATRGIIGRDREVEMMQMAYQRVMSASSPSSSLSPSSSGCEVLWVHGASGTGKTALVKHVFQTQESDIFFIDGKFDVTHNTARPYSAVVDALTALCHHTIWSHVSNEKILLEDLRRRIGDRNITILSKLIPAIEYKLGTWTISCSERHGTNGSGTLGTTCIDATYDKHGGLSCNKEQASTFLSTNHGMEDSSETMEKTFAFTSFTDVVRSFIFTVVRALPSPLVLFFDDVQAADHESMSIISSLASSHSESYNLLLVLAYRETSLDGNSTMDRKGNFVMNSTSSNNNMVPIMDIEVGNLDTNQLNQVVSQLLQMDPEETISLSELVMQRTGGNIYFSLQFLDMLKEELLLGYSFHKEPCRWSWNLEKIMADTNVTDNVAQLLASKIKQFSPDVQALLRVAASLGFYFDIAIVERILLCTRPDESCRARQFRRAVNLLSMEENLIDRAGIDTKYKFTHDLVLQTVYDSIPAGKERAMLHLQIGQVLWTELQNNDASGSDQRQLSDDWIIFAAADQLNKGFDFYNNIVRSDKAVTECLPLDLAKLNMQAGKAAMDKTAFKCAAGFFDNGSKLVEDMWEEEYNICLELHTLSAEANHAANNFDKCYRAIKQVIARGQCLDDKLRVFLVKVKIMGVRGHLHTAIHESMEVLRLLGERIPLRVTTLQVIRELRRVKRSMKGMTAVGLKSLPDMKCQQKIWTVKFLQHITMFAWFNGDGKTLAMAVGRMMRLTVQYGVSQQAAFSVACYGLIQGSLGNLSAAYEFGRVALDIVKRTRSNPCYAATHSTIYACLEHLKTPLIRGLDHVLHGYHVGIRSGEIEGAAMCLTAYGIMSLHLGKKLDFILEEMQGFRQAYRNEMESNFTMRCLMPYHQFVLNMMGRSRDPLKLTGEIICEEKFIIGGHRMSIASLDIARMFLHYVLDEAELAYKRVSSFNVKILSKSTHFSVPFIFMYSGLILLAMARKTGKGKFLTQAKMFQERLEKYARAGNVNTPPLLYLITAVRTSLQNRRSPEDVRKSFVAAVRVAAQCGFSVIEAIANERAGEYMHSIGDTYWSKLFLTRALSLYNEWGAIAKTNQLVKKYLFLAESNSSFHKSVGIALRKRYSFKESDERRIIGLH